MNKIPHNRKNITIKQYRILRKMFFQKNNINEICKCLNLTRRIIYRIINEHSLLEKRNRYYQYLCKYSYSNHESILSVSKRVCIKENILYRVKRNLKINTIRFNIYNKRNSFEIENMMIKSYKEGLSSKEIAIKCGFKTSKTVLDVLKKNNIKRRSYSEYSEYNRSFFKRIDSHDKAYILGLLLTDGYVLKDYRGFGIQLTETDKYILNKIASRLGKSTSVINIKCDTKRKTMPNVKDMARLHCHCCEMAKDLKKFNMVRRKTKILKYPKIPKKFTSSFYRGLWDGDGTVGIAKNNNIWCQIVSASKKFVYGIHKNCPFKSTIQEKPKSGSVYTVRISGGNQETVKFLKWIYKHKGDLFLERKYAKVQNKIS